MTLPEAVSSSIFVGFGHIGHVYDIVAVEEEQEASQPSRHRLISGQTRVIQASDAHQPRVRVPPSMVKFCWRDSHGMD